MQISKVKILTNYFNSHSFNLQNCIYTGKCTDHFSIKVLVILLIVKSFHLWRMLSFDESHIWNSILGFLFSLSLLTAIFLMQNFFFFRCNDIYQSFFLWYLVYKALPLAVIVTERFTEGLHINGMKIIIHSFLLFLLFI